MSKIYDTNFTDSEEGRDLREAADRRIASALALLPAWRGNDPVDQQIQGLLDTLLLNPKIWAVVQDELIAKILRKKPGAKQKYTVDKLCTLARAFDAYKASEKHTLKIGDKELMRRFRKKHGHQFSWLPRSNKSAVDLARGGRRLCAPAAQRLIKARRECLALGSTKDLFEDEQKKIRSKQISDEELHNESTLAELANKAGRSALLAAGYATLPGLKRSEK